MVTVSQHHRIIKLLSRSLPLIGKSRLMLSIHSCPFLAALCNSAFWIMRLDVYSPCIYFRTQFLKFWMLENTLFLTFLTFWHRSFTVNSNKSPTWCNNFSVYYSDVCLQLNMFRTFSHPSSGAQWLQWQPLILPSYRGDSRTVFVVGPTTNTARLSG